MLYKIVGLFWEQPKWVFVRSQTIYSSSQETEVCPMPYAQCPMRYALYRQHPDSNSFTLITFDLWQKHLALSATN